MRKNILISLFLILVLSGYFFTNLLLKKSRINDLDNRVNMTKSYLSPTLLKVLAGEFKGIIADYTLIEAASMVGSENLSDKDWAIVNHRFQQTMALDPWFDQSCHLIQASIHWNTDKLNLYYNLGEKSRKSRYWDWVPGFFLGFNYFYFENDYKKASEVFIETSKIENSPKPLGIIGTRLAQKSGQNRVAIKLLQKMYENEEDELVKKQLRERIRIHIYLDILEKNIKEHFIKFGHFPNELKDLVKEGFLNKIESTPYGREYEYDNNTGIVSF